MRSINEIVVHCAATRPDMYEGKSLEYKIEQITAWHKARNFRTIGYHFVIDRDGRTLPGRPVAEQGAHVLGRNANTIGICLWGGYGGGKHDKFSDNFTAAQDLALRQLIASLQAKYGPNLHLSGHHEYANKACPTFDVRSWYAGKPAIQTAPELEPAPEVLPDEPMGGPPADESPTVFDIPDPIFPEGLDRDQVNRWRWAQAREMARRIDVLATAILND